MNDTARLETYRVSLFHMAFERGGIVSTAPESLVQTVESGGHPADYSCFHSLALYVTTTNCLFKPRYPARVMKFVLVLVLLACALSLSVKERMEVAAMERVEALEAALSEEALLARELERISCMCCGGTITCQCC